MHGHAFQQQQGGRRIFFRTAPEEFRGADALDGFDRGWTYIINEICKLTDNQKKTPSFSEMSGKYGYLKRYIRKMFKKFTEISFSDYMLNFRISKAKTLLRLTISHCRHHRRIGIYDACHFPRSVHLLACMTPSKCRKRS